MTRRLKKTIGILAGLLVIAGVLLFLLWQDSDYLEVHFLDVGQGDAILIQTPSDYTVLIDGGPDASVASKVGRVLPFYDNIIELMVLTHAHADHVAGLVEVLKRYEVRHVLYAGVQHEAAEFRAWHELIIEQAIPVTIAHGGQRFVFEQAALSVLYPLADISEQEFDDLNDSSVVTKLTYGSTSYLFMGDASIGIEEELFQHQHASTVQLKSDVVKVGHHGSRYSSSLEFLQAVAPRFAVIQSGEGNHFGHPHRQVVKRLHGLGIVTLRNDELGTITLKSDGSEVWLEE